MHCKDTILRTQNNWPYSKLIPNSGKFYYWRKKLTEAMLPQAGGFVPVNMFDQNGKLGMSVTGSAKEATDHVPCEVVYPNGVVLRIQSELSLEALRSLILLCR